MYSMMEDNSDTFRSKKFKKLTKAICGLVSRVLVLVFNEILVVYIQKTKIVYVSR